MITMEVMERYSRQLYLEYTRIRWHMKRNSGYGTLTKTAYFGVEL